MSDIYDTINKVRRELFDKAGCEGPLTSLSADDWCVDHNHDLSLGDPDADWCVSVINDDVTIWAAGAPEWQGAIPGAGMEAMSAAIRMDIIAACEGKTPAALVPYLLHEEDPAEAEGMICRHLGVDVDYELTDEDIADVLTAF